MTSEDALLRAVVEHLRSTLNLAPDACEVELEPTAYPTSPEVFYAVTPGSWSPASRVDERYIHESLSVDVHIIMRASVYTADRRAKEVLLKNLGNINIKCGAVRGALHMNETLRELANTYIDDGCTDKLFTPLRWTGCGRAQTVSGEAWMSRPDAAAGIVRTVSFDGAERIIK